MTEDLKHIATAIRDSKAPAIARAAAILRLLGRSPVALGLQPIARALGLVPSTCLYVLRALVAEELVAFDPETKRYALDAGVLTLARQWLRGNQFAELAQPILDRVALAFDVTTLGVQIAGLDHVVVVAVSRSVGNFRLSTQIGSRFPALISATGRCVAAFGDYREAELKRRFDTLRWDDPPSFADWQAQVDQTRERGYGLDEGSYIAGVTVITAPVRSAHGRPVQALVATGLSSALQRGGIGALADALVAGAQSIANQLGSGGA